MIMMTLEELHAHYKAVRSRLDGPVVKKLVPVARIEPPPVVEVVVEEPPVVAVQYPVLSETPAQKILREVAEKHGLTVAELKSDARLKVYVHGRQEASYRLNTELGFSLKQIGRVLGNRDHTTVLNAIQKYKKSLAKGDEPWARSCVSDDDDKKR
jgi:chromosomal replication initiator protein